jgi:hypothetical protein
MSFSVNALRGAMGLGVRPNLFRVSFATGFVGPAGSQASVLVKSAALPGDSVGMIEVPHMGGRRLKVAGDRTFADWTMTVLNDKDYTVRTALQNYQNQFVSIDYTTSTVGARTASGAPAALTLITVEQLDTDGASTLRTYNLNNCFVTEISSIDLSYDSTDAIEEYTVTWAYDYFTVA